MKKTKKTEDKKMFFAWSGVNSKLQFLLNQKNYDKKSK